MFTRTGGTIERTALNTRDRTNQLLQILKI